MNLNLEASARILASWLVFGKNAFVPLGWGRCTLMGTEEHVCRLVFPRCGVVAIVAAVFVTKTHCIFYEKQALYTSCVFDMFFIHQTMFCRVGLTHDGARRPGWTPESSLVRLWNLSDVFKCSFTTESFF